MADPQQDAANREALLRRLLAGGELTPPPPIAPVASHPARDAVLLESRRRGDDMIQRARINETPEISLGEMRGIENNWEPGLEKWGVTRPDMERLTELVMAMGPASLDDVAAKLGKPPGWFKTVVEKLPGDTYRVEIREGPLGLRAGSIDMGDQVVQNHLSVDLTRSNENLRDKGFGREMYQEAINAAKQRGYSGLASNPAMRNQYSERIWNREGVTRGVPGRNSWEQFDLMSEYRPKDPGAAPTPAASQEPIATPAASQEPTPGLMETLRRQMNPVASEPTPQTLAERLRRSLERVEAARRRGEGRLATSRVASHPARSEVLVATGKPSGTPRVLDLTKFSAEDEDAISKAFGTDQWSVNMLRQSLESPEFGAKLPYDAYQYDWAGIPLTRIPKK